MKEAIQTANLKNLGTTKDIDSYDLSLRAINLNQAKDGDSLRAS